MVKRDKILIHATTWMSLENILLSERKPDTQKNRIIPHI